MLPLSPLKGSWLHPEQGASEDKMTPGGNKGQRQGGWELIFSSKWTQTPRRAKQAERPWDSGSLLVLATLLPAPFRHLPFPLRPCLGPFPGRPSDQPECPGSL